MKTPIAITVVLLILMASIWSQNKEISEQRQLIEKRDQLIVDMAILNNGRQQVHNEVAVEQNIQLARSTDAMNRATAEILRLKRENYMLAQMLFSLRSSRPTNELPADVKDIEID